MSFPGRWKIAWSGYIEVDTLGDLGITGLRKVYEKTGSAVTFLIDEVPDLRESDLAHVILKGINLERANLQKANLQGANLQYANLAGADLQRTVLQGADLRWADLQQANVADAYLEGAMASIFQQSILQNAGADTSQMVFLLDDWGMRGVDMSIEV